MLIKCKSYFIAIGILIRCLLFCSQARPKETFSLFPPLLPSTYRLLVLSGVRGFSPDRPRGIKHRIRVNEKRPPFNFPFGLGIRDRLLGLHYFSCLPPRLPTESTLPRVFSLFLKRGRKEETSAEGVTATPRTFSIRQMLPQDHLSFRQLLSFFFLFFRWTRVCDSFRTKCNARKIYPVLTTARGFYYTRLIFDSRIFWLQYVICQLAVCDIKYYLFGTRYAIRERALYYTRSRENWIFLCANKKSLEINYFFSWSFIIRKTYNKTSRKIYHWLTGFSITTGFQLVRKLCWYVESPG